MRIKESDVRKEFGTVDPVKIGRLIRREAAREFMKKISLRRKSRIHLAT